MTTLNKVQEIISIFGLVHEDNVYLLNKLKELEQDIINNLNVDHEEI